MLQASCNVGKHHIFCNKSDFHLYAVKKRVSASSQCFHRHSMVLRCKETYKHSCLWTILIIQSPPISIWEVSQPHLSEWLSYTSWCKHYDDDYRGKLNTVRFTGKPADTEGKRNPGVELSHFKSSVYILWISKRRTSVSYQIGGSTFLEEQNNMLVFIQCGKMMFA